MHSLSHSHLPERCPQCPPPEGFEPKPIHTHKYGDYVVLRLDGKGSEKMEELGKTIGKLVQETLGLGEGAVEINSSDRMHLTLAMPLRPMSRTKASEFIQFINEIVSGPLNFDLVFRGKDQGGSHAFSFSSKNYAPSFDVRLTEQAVDEKDQTITHNEHNAIPTTVMDCSPYNKLCDLADSIQNYAVREQLVNLERNTDGKCNAFNPHITLGNLKNHENCKLLHNRVQHRAVGENALSHLASQAASNAFKCENEAHKNCNTLPLSFNKVEILRVDALEGGSKSTHCLASLDLTTRKISLGNSFPSCSHQEEPHREVNEPSSQIPQQTVTVHSDQSSPKPKRVNFKKEIKSKVKELLPNLSYKPTVKAGYDEQQKPAIIVEFQNEKQAKRFQKRARISGQIRKVEGSYRIQLGEVRCKTIFGEDRGNKIYQKAASKLRK